MSRVEELGLGLIQCTANLVTLLTDEPLKTEIEGAQRRDSVCIRKMSCAYYGILDAAASLAYNAQGQPFSDDEQQSVMHALVWMLGQYTQLDEETAKQATRDLFKDMQKPEFKKLCHEWGQKGHDATTGNVVTLAKLEAFGVEARSGRKVDADAHMGFPSLMKGMLDVPPAQARPPSASASTGQGRCFIATACYGGLDAPEVVVLRAFRDENLLRTKLGELLVECYYRISPCIADWLLRHRWLAKTVRSCFLDPIVRWIHREKK